MKKPPPGLVTSRSKPPPKPHRHPHPQRHHPGGGGHRMTHPLVPAPAPLPRHKHKAPKHKKAKPHPRRKLSPGDVACCAAEALAASLRLAGVPVGDEDVLALYWRTAGDADAGATLSATLEAAAEFGLSGFRLASFDLIGHLDERCRDVACLGCREVVGALLLAEQLDDGAVDAAPAPELADGGRVDRRLVAAQQPGNALIGHGGSVVLGVTLPGGPHALTLDPSGAVWSWGELYDPGGIEIEEAWLVDWGA